MTSNKQLRCPVGARTLREGPAVYPALCAPAAVLHMPCKSREAVNKSRIKGRVIFHLPLWALHKDISPGPREWRVSNRYPVGAYCR